MASLTNAQIRSITNYSLVVYFGGNLLPAVASGDHTIRHIDSNTAFGSSLTGDNGALLSVRDGMHAEFEVTFRGMGKNDIVNILNGVATEKTTSTSSANPFAGNVEYVSNPNVIPRDALVVYPLFTDRAEDGGTGIAYQPNNSNPMATLFYKASYVDSFEFSMSSGSVTDVTCLFRCHVDALNENRYALQGTGIASDGTVT